ncbi:MAG: YgjV family protein [Oscillospiraceae bacterium]|nr:YgjV family protein [Oscillospiraceae bacterium]
MFVFSQIFAGLALITVIISILSKTKKNILLYRILNTIFYAASFAFVFRWVTVGNLIFGSVRFYVYYLYKAKGKKPSLHILITFILLLIAMSWAMWHLGIWTEWIEIPIVFVSFITAWAFWQENETVIRLIMLLATSCWLYYNIKTSNYMGIVLESIIQVFQVIAVVRYDILKKESLIKER